MRILYCNKYNFAFSGTEVYLFDVMELMRAKGHTVALFSMADPRGKSSEYDRHFVPHVDFKNGNHGIIGAAKLAGNAIYSRTARVRLRKMIAEFRPDVAHVRNIYHHLSPSILWELQAQGVPVVYHINDFKLVLATTWCLTAMLVSVATTGNSGMCLPKDAIQDLRAQSWCWRRKHIFTIGCGRTKSASPDSWRLAGS